MNKDKRKTKSFIKICFVIMSIGILFYNPSVFGWLSPSNTFGLLSGYSQSPYVAAMDVVDISKTSTGSESYIWCAKYFYNNQTGAVGVEAIFIDYKYVYPNRSCTYQQEIVAPTGQWMQTSCSPAICINRSDYWPQILCKNWNQGHHLIHYYRNPNANPVWQASYITTTECQGSPAMICNQIPPYNLEVVYRDWNGNYRHMYREDQAHNYLWRENGTLLPLPSNCSAYGDPVMTQTTDGTIYVAAIVYNNGYYDLAHWSRAAHDANWNTATVGTVGMENGRPVPSVHPTNQLTRPAIVELIGNTVVVICRSTNNYSATWWNTLGGFKTYTNNVYQLHYYSGGELILNSSKVSGWNDNGRIFNIAGVYLRNINEIVLNVTQLNRDYSTNDFLIETHCPPN